MKKIFNRDKKVVAFLAMPSHTSQIEWGAATAMFQPGQNRNVEVMTSISVGSLLALNFNRLWCVALNNRKKHNIKWFAMLHGDVVPEPLWLDKMIRIAEANNADALSVVIPFKDQSGLTSTAIGSDDPYQPRTRLTLSQVAQLPDTFDSIAVCKLLGFEQLPLPALLINTGCMLIRFDRRWVDQLHFEISDQIRQNTTGEYYPVTEPEDWFFSRQLAAHGAKVMATKAIQVEHVGKRNYGNHQVWGAEFDENLYKHLTTKKMDGTIWSLEEAKTLHVHSPGLAKWITTQFKPNEYYYDLGCGKGDYLKALDDAGCKYGIGFEGTPGIEQIASINSVHEFDITKPLTNGFPGNVICLEVMEHIEPEKEFLVLENINRLCSNMLVLSWAVEGQNGYGHINCRNADYVVPRIEKMGFKIDFLLTMEARAAAVSNNGPAFFNNSLYIFKREYR